MNYQVASGMAITALPVTVVVFGSRRKSGFARCTIQLLKVRATHPGPVDVMRRPGNGARHVRGR